MARYEEGLREGYINTLFAPESPLLSRIRRDLEQTRWRGVHIHPFEGRLLQFLMGVVAARKVVELGTLWGYSSLWMAGALPRGGKLITVEADLSCYKRACDNIKESERASQVELLHGRAEQVLSSIESEGPFDMIFIDANKSGYLDYLNWAEFHVRRGGLIVGDNTFLFGDVYQCEEQASNPRQREVMREFNHRLADPEKYDSILLPTGEGMTVAVKKF